jgi:hypothetical protein
VLVPMAASSDSGGGDPTRRLVLLARGVIIGMVESVTSRDPTSSL